MRNRTMVIAAASVTAALAAGSIGAAVASTTGAKPGPHPKIVSASAKPAADTDLAARLGVSPARLDHALLAIKISLSKASVKPTEGQFSAALARLLGIPQARIRHAFMAEKRAVNKAVGSKAAARADQEALAAAVARALNVSPARVDAALRPLFEAGRADSSSAAFAVAARSLGVSPQRLSAALMHAKQSLAGGK